MSDLIDEGGMYGLLHAKVCGNGSGNGPVAILAPGVRSAAGFDAKRTIDAVSVGLWPSRGLRLDGYEIKISRSDWKRELKNPAKAEEFAGLVDRLWLVVSDPKIIEVEEELPDGWGLLVREDGALVQKVKAEAIAPGPALPPRFGRSFLAALIRSANSVPPDVRAELKAQAETTATYEIQQGRELKTRVEAFEKAAGIKITEWNGDPKVAAERGKAFKAALEGEERVERLRRDAEYIASGAKRLAKDAQEIASRPEKTE